MIFVTSIVKRRKFIRLRGEYWKMLARSASVFHLSSKVIPTAKQKRDEICSPLFCFAVGGSGLLHTKGSAFITHRGRGRPRTTREKRGQRCTGSNERTVVLLVRGRPACDNRFYPRIHIAGGDARVPCEKNRGQGLLSCWYAGVPPATIVSTHVYTSRAGTPTYHTHTHRGRGRPLTTDKKKEDIP